MNFKVKKVTEQIFLFVFPNKELTCRTMVRFAEHFESPKWRGKLFSWRQFKSWYTWQQGGFSYYQDWAGFNIPAHVFAPFIRGEFDPLTWGEKDVLETLKGATGDFYVIACSEDDASTLRHEVAHAFFYLDPVYRDAVRNIMVDLPAKDIATENLKMMSYHDGVIEDELHAYTMDGLRAIDGYLGIRSEAGLMAFFKYWRASRKLNRLLDETLERHEAEHVAY